MEQRQTVPTRSLAMAALAGFATFPIAVIILNLVQRGEYNALTQPMSQLALGTGGWLMTVAFCTTGLGLLMLALLVRRTVPEARVVPGLLALAGMLHFVAAAFPTDPIGVPPTVHGLIHNISGLTMFVMVVVVMVIAGFSFRTSPEWRSFSRATFVWSGAAIVAFFLMLILGGLHLFGLGQRIAVASWLTWMMVVAWRALRSRMRHEHLSTSGLTRSSSATP